MEIIKRHKEELHKSSAKPHNLPLIEAKNRKELEEFSSRCEEDLKRKDMKVILELDQQVMDQQVTLEKAGIPGFHVTNNPQDIQLQMYLLDFISKLSEKPHDSFSWSPISPATTDHSSICM